MNNTNSPIPYIEEEEAEPPPAPPRPPSFPVKIVCLMWLLVFITASLVTFILPEYYASTARIRLQRDQSDITEVQGKPAPTGYDPSLMETAFEVMTWDVVLGQVIEDLKLRQEWGKRYAGGEPLKQTEAICMLNRRISLRPVSNTSLVEITVYSGNSREAAKIANGIALAYRDYRLEQAATGLPEIPVVEIVDQAVPGRRPVRPNKALNIVTGIVVGGIAAGLLGTTIFLLRRRAYRRQADSGTSAGLPPGCRSSLHGVVALVVGLFIGYNCPFWAGSLSPGGLFPIVLALVIGASISAYIELAKSAPVSQTPAPTPSASGSLQP